MLHGVRRARLLIRAAPHDGERMYLKRPWVSLSLASEDLAQGQVVERRPEKTSWVRTWDQASAHLFEVLMPLRRCLNARKTTQEQSR